jgi:signal transduction histidine kinase
MIKLSHVVNKYRNMMIILLCSLIILAGGLVYAQTEQVHSVQNGAVDLSSLVQPIYSLEGEWEFYRNQLLTSEQIQQSAYKPDLIQITVPWKKQHAVNPLLDQTHYGTYKLRMKLAPTEVGQERALYISDIASAYFVWIDGTSRGGIGKVGMSLEAEEPKSRAELIFFEPKSEEVTIIIQASNFTSRNEGTFKAMRYGDADKIVGQMITNQLMAAVTIGGLLILGLYHLVIYIIRKKDRSTLYIGLLAVDIGVRGWIRSTYLIDLIVPNMSWEVIVKLDYITGYLAYLFLALLMNTMYPQESNRRMLLVSHVFTTVLCLYIILSPATTYTRTLSIQFTLMFVISIFTVGYVCVMAVKRRREGAVVNLIGYLIIAIASVNDVLLYQRMVDTTELLYEAIFLFILLQAIIISYRYSRLFHNNILLNQTLEQKVDERTVDLYSKNEQLANMQRSRAEMMANISHDMGSPITGIQMNMQLLKEGLIQQEQQPQFVQSLLDKVAQIKRLNDDLFELSVIESGQIGFQFKRAALNSFLEHLVRKLSSDLNNEGMQLQVGHTDAEAYNLDAWIHIDALRINLVIDKFISNAINFNGNLHTSIVVNFRIIAANANNSTTPYDVVIEVKDHGPGIADDQLPHVFDRFYMKSEGNVNGSGLGLAIVKEIVERHQGRVDVVSKLEEGNTFSFTLPVHFPVDKAPLSNKENEHKAMAPTLI